MSKLFRDELLAISIRSLQRMDFQCITAYFKQYLSHHVAGFTMKDIEFITKAM